MKARTTDTDLFPTDVAGLPQATPTRAFDLADGQELELRIAPVAKKIGDATVRMLAYGGSIPGPTLRVRQGSEIVVNVVNDGDLDGTVHWHGLRLENRYDGTTETQAPIPVGGSFRYRLTFPDPGVYWYHPHIREDYGQEMGLYGNIIVEPADADYWPPAHREVTLTLDDLLVEHGAIAPFHRNETTHSAMGRFGNVLLVNGAPGASFTARRGEVVRFFVTNTANTRVFRLAMPGARMKLVGGDSGRVEHETIIESVVIAPSERVVVDVLFDGAGEVSLEHRTPKKTYTLGKVIVAESAVAPSLAEAFGRLRTNADLVAERGRLAAHLAAAPDRTLALVAEMNMGEPEGGAAAYFCPMHPEVRSEEQGRCPKCGMKLLPAPPEPAGYVCPMHPEVTSAHADRCPKCGMKLVAAGLVQKAGHSEHHHDAPHGASGGEHAPASDGIEWEDDMVEVNRMTTPANTRWKLVDRATGAEGGAIAWRFRVGDRVKLRLVNEMDSDHPMHHPFHIHGAGRFLVLARDGAVEPNLVWKDTVLVPTGQTVDLLLEVTNAGRWMAHCHIAEHHESGMMLSFDVEA
jgi:FtsP/CotA-like multicopper oxidase with cupredoxin domain